MKRRKKLILLCGVILFLTCGCSNNTKELEDRIKILETKIDKLEENKTTITKKELIGVWKLSIGEIGMWIGNEITITEDGNFVVKRDNGDFNYGYELLETTIIVCSKYIQDDKGNYNSVVLNGCLYGNDKDVEWNNEYRYIYDNNQKKLFLYTKGNGVAIYTKVN